MNYSEAIMNLNIPSFSLKSKNTLQFDNKEY